MLVLIKGPPPSRPPLYRPNGPARIGRIPRVAAALAGRVAPNGCCWRL